MAFDSEKIVMLLVLKERQVSWCNFTVLDQKFRRLERSGQQNLEIEILTMLVGRHSLTKNKQHV